MRLNVLTTLLISGVALVAAGSDAGAQPQGPRVRPMMPVAQPTVTQAAPAQTGVDATKPVVGPNGKQTADTQGLSQFESGIEYAPRAGEERVSFSLEDADLPELVRVIGELTGKRFIFGGKVRNIKATVFSPQKVTVAEAYQAFLSILETNGLTVVPARTLLQDRRVAGRQDGRAGVRRGSSGDRARIATSRASIACVT